MSSGCLRRWRGPPPSTDAVVGPRPRDEWPVGFRRSSSDGGGEKASKKSEVMGEALWPHEPYMIYDTGMISHGDVIGGIACRRLVQGPRPVRWRPDHRSRAMCSLLERPPCRRHRVGPGRGGTPGPSLRVVRQRAARRGAVGTAVPSQPHRTDPRDRAPIPDSVV